jgi:PAS domain S-box-containing protein
LAILADAFDDSKFFDLGLNSASPEMARRIAHKDWTQTPLGPPQAWPPVLRTILEVALANRFATVLWWGPQLIQFYNDQYRPMLGAKHPESLGQTGPECWHEIWDVVGPQIEQVYSGGPSTWNEDLALDIYRYGFVEETYFTFSYSAVPDPSAPNGIGGVMGTVQETTRKVIGERRIRLLRDLAVRATESLSVEEECRLAASTLERYPKLVPFALLYLLDDQGQTARLAATAGVERGTQPAPEAIDMGDATAQLWPLHKLESSDDTLVIDDLDKRLRSVPRGPWPEPPRTAIVLPIKSNVSHKPAGFLVAGVSPRVRFDDDYRGFFGLVAAQIASAIANARVYEEERKRAEALAEIDRAKNAFFSNVSHEFRTPLTLMLGPIEELSRDATPEALPLIQTAHRNALRLLKLVNTLLEFSRLEAGRNDAAFAPTDLGAATADLCALFRSAIESAGLTLRIDVDSHEPVYVDRAMWEKIVFNLLSNSLKFTLEGEIAVSVQLRENAAVLTVSDTGVGIPQKELPHLFERFRRVRGAKSRSHEGSGIGLALVEELVRAHGGTIAVESEIGAGTTFNVSIPLGTAHLDASKIVDDAQVHPTGRVAQQYLADVDATIVRADAVQSLTERLPGERRRCVLVADDNGDLRDYVSRILSPAHDVIAVRNGQEALEALRERSIDLIISDVMMPEMDGFELLRCVRGDDRLQEIPFIMLSARAGEEAAIEGLERGADDYLTKPFSAEELLARVYAHLSAASIREQALRELRSSEERFRNLATSMPHVVLETDPSGAVTFLSDSYREYTGLDVRTGYGSAIAALLHPEDITAATQAWKASMQGAEPFEHEFRLRRHDGQYRWHVARVLPQRDTKRQVLRWTGTITDVHDTKRVVEEREFLSNASRMLAESLDLPTTLRNIAKLTVPKFADWCQIDLRTPEGRIETVAVAHKDLHKHHLAQQFVGRVHLNAAGNAGNPYAIRTGRTQLIPDVPSIIEDAVADETEVEIYREMGLASAACVPLVAQGRTLGAIAFVYSDADRRYTPDDLPMLEELGRRAGLAVQNASEFGREHRASESFQEASLPATLPEMPGLTFDAIYVPGSTEAQVGGDWFDAVRLFDGRVVVSIGDVAGHGLQAAVTMGNMRQIIRGIAQVHADPALMLDAADRALRLEHPDRFVTAFVGVFDPIAGTFAYASAGHPPPILRRPDGSLELLSDRGLPLGLRKANQESDGLTLFVEPGSHFVFYTDGLTEFEREPAVGEERLKEVVADRAVFEDEHPAVTIRDRLLRSAGAAKDDVAILVMGVLDKAPDGSTDVDVRRWYYDARDADAARTAKTELGAYLRARGVSPESMYAAEVVFGELSGNVARHAGGRVEVILDWSGSAPVLHVLDEGFGFHHVPALPRDVFSESGRGLFIISKLSDDFHVSKRPGGGSHARVVLSMHHAARKHPLGQRRRA